MCQHPLAQQGCSTQSRGKIPVAPTVRPQIPKSTQEWGQETLQGLPPHPMGGSQHPTTNSLTPEEPLGRGRREKQTPRRGGTHQDVEGGNTCLGAGGWVAENFHLGILHHAGHRAVHQTVHARLRDAQFALQH